MRGRHDFPVYVVCTGGSEKMPFTLEDLYLITASLAFARCVTRYMQEQCVAIIRISQYNGCLHVNANSMDIARNLDRLRGHQHQPVVEAAYCKLCIKAGGTSTRAYKEVVGVNSTHEAPCQAHHHKWYPQYTHETVKLNTLSIFRAQQYRIKEMAEVCSAKLEWLGQLYFKRHFRHQLPGEVLQLIQDFLQ